MWRPNEAEDALEHCLARLRQGDRAEDCLAAYPDLSHELAPLLALSQMLLGLAAERPDPAPALARIRARFLRQVGQMRHSLEDN